MYKPSKRFFAVCSTFVLAAIVLLAYSYFIEAQRLVVTPYSAKIAGWDPAFDGLKIVMIGDVHGGSHYTTEEKIRRVVALANEQEPDLVVLLGDYVSQSGEKMPVHERGLKMSVETIGANLAGLKAKLGVFAVLGNHDGWYSNDAVSKVLANNGYKVLRNEVAVVEKDGHPLRILGIKDHLQLTKPWKATSKDLASLVADGQGSIIALEHSPDVMPIITGENSISPDLKLMLAAHTHGGQVWLPVLGRSIVPSSFGQKYVYGHVSENNVDLFVTSGVGMSVLPFRFMVPPEIAVVTVRTE